MKMLREVKDFGAIAAEDDDLRRFFVQTPVYEELLRGERQVVVGRKGSGKTALYLALIDRTDGSSFFARGLAFSDYPWALHARYAHEAKTGHDRFLSSWRFLAFMEIFKVLLTQEKREARYSNSDAKAALAAVEKFIQANWGAIAFDYKKTFPSGGFKLTGLSFAPQVMGFALGGLNIDRDGSLSETLERLNEWLWNALVVIGANSPTIYVLFDELDAGYTPTAEDYVDRVTGLLLAVRRMARDFRAAALPYHAIAFLRSDIYDNLHFGDKNKLTETNVTQLAWNDDLADYFGSSLSQLIDHRIREAMDLPSGENDPWSKAFESDLMRGTQHKFNHMTFRTYLRPRDIIQFSNEALREYKKRVTTSPGNGASLINNLDIINARKAYSRYLLKELDDEIATVTPRWSDYLEVLRRIKATRFTRQAFEEAYAAVHQMLPPDVSVEELLQFLYRYSIIGFERAAGASGLEIHFRYLDESIRFNPDAKAFMVHRGLKEALELRDAGDAVEYLA
jgi:hypothetical protein